MPRAERPTADPTSTCEPRVTPRWVPEAWTNLYIGLHVLTYLDSFISICCRISCLSSSVLLGKMFRSSSSCLLGRFLSFTASNSFLHFLGNVPVRPTRMRNRSYRCSLQWMGSGARSRGLELKRDNPHGLHCAVSRGSVGSAGCMIHIRPPVACSTTAVSHVPSVQELETWVTMAHILSQSHLHEFHSN